MTLLEALTIVCELADQNVLEGGEATNHELQDERVRQLEALEVVDSFMTLLIE